MKHKFFILLFMIIAGAAHSQVYYLLVGSYTQGNTDGIHVYKFNAQRAITTFVSKATGVENASYLAVSPNQKYIYAVNEHPGRPGEISAFAFDKTKGELKLINKQPAGESPCYISVDSTGRFIMVAEYGSGLSVYRANPDGSIGKKLQSIQHDGYGIVYERQDKSHVHSVVFSPDQKFLFVPDLGNDRLYQYNFNPADTATPLSPAQVPYYALPDGSGPRHFVFHPGGKTAYLVNELIGEVVAYEYADGQLKEIQTIASTTEGEKYAKGSADIHISPNAKFLFTSNRGKANDITSYMISKEGKLNKSGQQVVNDHPRNFTIDPTGKFLLVASRDKNTIQIFAINPNFGLLEEVGERIQVDKPVFLTMIPAK
jgi:6-phosphogluconolactonase